MSAQDILLKDLFKHFSSVDTFISRLRIICSGYFFTSFGFNISGSVQIQALPALASFLKHYLFLEVGEMGLKNYRLFANGNTNLVFQLNENASLTKIGESRIEKATLLGQIGTSIDLKLTAGTKLLVVVFQPYGLNALTRIPAHELKDCIIEAESVLGKRIEEIQDIILESDKKANLVKKLNAYFFQIFSSKKPMNHRSLPDMIHEIILKKGDMTIQDIKEKFFVHERTLQRLFAEQVGLSPKKFIQIAKLHSFIGKVKSNERICDSVYETGYFDHSHLIKEFKGVTGMTPTQYSKSKSLAVNLVELS